jgi:ribosome maturation factor RimP
LALVKWVDKPTFLIYGRKLIRFESMRKQEQKIIELIHPLLKGKNLFLIKLELKGQLNNQVLSIYLDNVDGITMKEITEITHDIEDCLDIYDPIKGRYRLEISSPGVDWPLTESWQFQKNLNRDMEIKYSNSIGTEKITGTLLGIKDNEIEVQVDNRIIKISLDKIEKAVVKLNW